MGRKSLGCLAANFWAASTGASGAHPVVCEFQGAGIEVEPALFKVAPRVPWPLLLFLFQLAAVASGRQQQTSVAAMVLTSGLLMAAIVLGGGLWWQSLAVVFYGSSSSSPW